MRLGLGGQALLEEGALLGRHAFVFIEHVGLIGVDHDLDQAQDFLLAVVGQGAVHADGRDVIAERGERGAHGGQFQIGGINHGVLLHAGQPFHHPGKRVHAAHRAEHPPIRVAARVGSTERGVEVAEAAGFAGADGTFHAASR